MKNEAFEKFCDEAELPTMSQFTTKLACDAARERATFNAGFEAGQVAEREECAKMADSSKRCLAETNDCIKTQIACTDCVAAAIRARK